MAPSNNAQLFELSDELRTSVESELNSQEQIIWVEQPDSWRLARATLPVLLFAIPWTAFALFWTSMAAVGVGQGAGMGPLRWAFPLFGVPFIVIGLGMLSSPYWAFRSAKRSVYILTTQRAILLHGGWFSINVRSFEPAALTSLDRKQRRDGSGDLIFTHDWRPHNNGHAAGNNVGFVAVRDVKHVEDLVRTLAQQAAGRSKTSEESA
jgi:hypothetical protein